MKINKLFEEWRPVVGYDGMYEVSSLGNVKSLNYRRTGKERILKRCPDKDGYLQVGLSVNGKMKMHFVHRLVAGSFILNPNNLPEVNHRDEDKTNNKVSNLEWCNRKYNCNYGSRNARFTEKLTNYPSFSKPVLQYTLTGRLVAEFPSVREAGRQTGINNGNICRCCNGEYKTSGGFIWKYAS